ncbi:MAG: D-xylose ABC transporter ATP-binding protein [Candidatus Nealsonbacteria bacterium]|nr:MAG: D-xylose ABC transporter ATP-binding protein [Candidatus Nealsonbacteria bacterium]
MDDLLLLMEGIDKSFPGVDALKKCRFELKAGEVHALVGENGAGKSTLMKVVAGVYSKDAGRIFYKGKEVNIPNPRAAQRLGISMVHQELNLMSHLTAAQNIFIGREPIRGARIILDENTLNDKAQEIFDMLHMKLNPRTKVANMSVAKQQMVEIAKALSFYSDVLILDEPTAALAQVEIVELFRIIRQLRDKGVGIIYISHRLEELKQISDRITVMRDGLYVDTVLTQGVDIDQIIKMMVGRVIYESSPEIPENPSQEVVLEVKNLNRGNEIKNVSFSLKRGEILGFAGLVGAGRTEVARAVFGADSFDSGEIIVKGKKVKIKSPSDAVSHDIGYLSEDRKQYGLCLGLDVETNISLVIISKLTGFLGWIKNIKVLEIVKRIVDKLSIKTPSLNQKVKNLSGGNQQKLVVGKWLAKDTGILLFDEPTRGIDVGAKSEIYHLLNNLAHQGKSIIMISSELPEILRMSHRVVVMCEGRITGELDYGEATQESIMQLATLRNNENVLNN